VLHQAQITSRIRGPRYRRKEKLAQHLQLLYDVATVSSLAVSQIVPACSELHGASLRHPHVRARSKGAMN
jgi:hypothetical protein